MSDEEKIEKSDESILFPEVRIGEIVVKPWSFGMLFEVSPHLEKVLDKAEESGLVKKFEDSAGGTLPYTIIARLFTIASPHIIEILALTVGKEVDEIKNLEMEIGLKLAVTVYNQNKTTITNSLKNVFSPPKKEKPKGGQK